MIFRLMLDISLNGIYIGSVINYIGLSMRVVILL